MGGLGSGSQNRWATKTDELLRLDLAGFKPDWFETQQRGTSRWSRGGRETASIGYELAPDHMRLHYTAGRGEDRVSIDERIHFDFTEQPFGGSRRWFQCASCGRRCRVLYGSRYFRCRQCYRATYPSQYETFRVRGLAKAEKARERVGAEPGIANPFPGKPKGMHWRTYRRLEASNWEAALAIDRVLAGLLA